MLGLIVFWCVIIVSVACASVRYISIHKCMLVKRGSRIIRFGQGFNFLIPFYDKIVADFAISATDIVFCKFSANGGEYIVRASYKIAEDKINEDILPLFSSVPKLVANVLEQKLNSSEDSIEGMDLSLLATELEKDVSELTSSKGIVLSNFKINENV